MIIKVFNILNKIFYNKINRCCFHSFKNYRFFNITIFNTIQKTCTVCVITNSKSIWINTNQNFSSKYIKDAKVLPRPGDPNVCDLQFKLDRLGKLQWQILAGMHIEQQVAFIVDGIYYAGFVPEPPKSEQNNWVTLRVGINPYTAKGIAKFAKKNYTYYNPSTDSWF